MPPSKLGRYEVVERLGQGAMGSVYKARDPVLDRTVAVKTLGGALLVPDEHRPEFLERFRREAKAAGRLSHPNVVSVHDLGVDEPTATPFIVMEYVAGVSLATVLKENPVLPLAQAFEIVEQVGAALDEAHRNGIVHRDIKPANVFLDARGRVKVGDFGIARMADSELTATGIGLGTPGYIAPEVLRGGKADARSDLFALGVLAYALLAGKRPFSADTRETLAIQVLEHSPEPPSAVRAEVPRAASAAVMRALAKRPEDRPDSVAAFLRELRGAADLATTPALGATRTLAGAAPPRPSRRLLLALLLALLALGGAAALLSWRASARDEAAAPASSPTPGAARATPSARPAPATTLAPKPTFTIEIPLPGSKPDPKDKKERKKGRGKGEDKKKD